MLLELIIGFQGVRLHWRIARLNMRWQHECNGRGVAALLAPTFEDEAYGIGMRRVAHQRLQDGVLQRRSTSSVRADVANPR